MTRIGGKNRGCEARQATLFGRAHQSRIANQQRENSNPRSRRAELPYPRRPSKTGFSHWRESSGSSPETSSTIQNPPEVQRTAAPASQDDGKPIADCTHAA